MARRPMKRVPKSTGKAKSNRRVELDHPYARSAIGAKQERERDYWTRELSALHARMQRLKARNAVDALFSASDPELNRRYT
jgi:hypothetical protein